MLHNIPAGIIAALQSYNIENAILLNGTDEYLSLTPGAASTGNEAIIVIPFQKARNATNETLYAVNSGSGADEISWYGDDKFRIQLRVNGAASYYVKTSAVYRDNTSTGCIIVSVDTNQPTAADRMRVWYWDDEITSFDTDQRGSIPSGGTIATGGTYAHNIGRHTNGDKYFSGYLATPMILLDVSIQQGDYAVSDFVERDTVTNNPKLKDFSKLSFGTKDTLLDMANGANLGANVGGTSDWTATNIDSTNQVTSTPTNVYGTIDPLWIAASMSLSNGNTKVTSDTGKGCCRTTLYLTGKKYWEVDATTVDSGNFVLGVVDNTADMDMGTGADPGMWGVNNNGTLYEDGSSSSPGYTYSQGDRVCFAFDADTGKLWMGTVSGGTASWFNSGDPAAGTGQITTVDNLDSLQYFPTHVDYRSTAGAQVADFYFNPDDWNNASVPTGFKALCTDNLPAVTDSIDNHLVIDLDTGANIETTAKANFTDYLTWIKDRDNINNHQVMDTVRGATAVLQTNTTAAETTYSAPSGNSVAVSVGFA